LPGDKIGHVEEFVPGKGVYAENGEIFAAVAGYVEIKERIVSIKNIKQRHV